MERQTVSRENLSVSVQRLYVMGAHYGVGVERVELLSLWSKVSVSFIGGLKGGGYLTWYKNAINKLEYQLLNSCTACTGLNCYVRRWWNGMPSSPLATARH